MKLSKKRIIIGLIFIVVLVSTTLSYLYKSSKKQQVKVLNLPIENSNYIEMDKGYKKVQHKEILNEIKNEFTHIKVKEISHKYNVESHDRKQIKILFLTNSNEKNVISSVVVYEDNKIEVENKYYKVVEDDSIYEKIKEIYDTCGQLLPELNESKIYKISYSKNIEMTTEEILSLYQKIRNALPIKQEKFVKTDQNIQILTLDDENIQIYVDGESYYLCMKTEYDERSYFVYR